MKSEKVAHQQAAPSVKVALEQQAKVQSKLSGSVITGGVNNVGSTVIAPVVSGSDIKGSLAQNSILTGGLKPEDAQNANQTTN